jgi:phospholipid/cholesterol/gamma-HCH transport system ATP-binding protein
MTPPKPSATTAAARVVGLKKSFDDNHVLRGVDAVFPAGRCSFVVGPSGTGKSVLVRHLVGLLQPDSGEVFLGDERVDTLAEEDLLELRKKCVYVFQHPTLFDSMTVSENVAVVMKYHLGLTVEAAQVKADEQLRKMGLGRLTRSKPTRLSSGDQKLVSLARALALEPDVLILDEPTTGLDPHAAYKLDQQIEVLAETGVTLLIISHDLRSIRRLADDVLFLFGGHVRFHGPVDDFFASTDAVVSQFVTGSVEGEI